MITCRIGSRANGLIFISDNRAASSAASVFALSNG